MKKLVYKEYPRAYGKSEAVRVAEKILGLRVEEILLKVAEAVRAGAPPRVIDCLQEAAKVRFRESLFHALKGEIKL